MMFKGTYCRCTKGDNTGHPTNCKCLRVEGGNIHKSIDSIEVRCGKELQYEGRLICFKRLSIVRIPVHECEVSQKLAGKVAWIVLWVLRYEVQDKDNCRRAKITAPFRNPLCRLVNPVI